MYDTTMELEQYGCDFAIDSTEDGHELLVTFQTAIGELTLQFDADEAEDLSAVLDAFCAFATRQQRNHH